MSRSQLTILTNICLIEDLETQRVVMQYRSPETNRWSGYAFPRRPCRKRRVFRRVCHS